LQAELFCRVEKGRGRRRGWKEGEEEKEEGKKVINCGRKLGWFATNCVLWRKSTSTEMLPMRCVCFTSRSGLTV